MNNVVLGEGLQREEQVWLADVINAHLEQNRRLGRELEAFEPAAMLPPETDDEAHWKQLEEAERSPGRQGSQKGPGARAGSDDSGSASWAGAAVPFAEFLGRQAADAADAAAREARAAGERAAADAAGAASRARAEAEQGSRQAEEAARKAAKQARGMGGGQ